MQNNMENTELRKTKRKKKLSPPVIIMLGFLSTIIMGSLILCLPFARKTDIAYLDLLFTSTSAVCVVGLTVLNFANSFTYFGQIVILLLIQIGGLGFMTITTLVFIFIGKKITLKERLTLSEAYNQDNLQGLVKLTKYIIFYTLIIELAGAVALSFNFVGQYGFLKGFYYSVFHAVSAFCNAGISLVDFAESTYSGNVLINISMMSLIFIGGLGFAVIRDIISRKRTQKLMFNSKIVLYTSITLILGSAILIGIAEWSNNATIGQESFFGKILRCLFQSITPRTAGFNTIVQSDMTGAGKIITVINMFIGASPGSTGGGIKTTTAFMLLIVLVSGIKGEDKEKTIFGRSLSNKMVHKAVMIFIYAIITLLVFSLLLMLFENGNDNISLESAIFETVSAFGTVGLSLGITPLLSPASRFLIIILMFIGRLGSLVLGLFFIQNKNNEKTIIKHPEAKLIIG